MMRYTAVTGIAALAVLGVTVFGFMLAGHAFSAPATADVASVPQSATEDATLKEPTSDLLGRTSDAPASTADASSETQPATRQRGGKDWVEVVDAVNMRSGPSSANPVVQVKLAGAQLQLGDRAGGWIQVIEPDSGAQGWVYEKYVKRISPDSARANPGTTRIQ